LLLSDYGAQVLKGDHKDISPEKFFVENAQRERSDKEKLEKEKNEKEKIAQKKMEKERIRKEIEQEKIEKERIETEKIEKQRNKKEKAILREELQTLPIEKWNESHVQIFLKEQGFKSKVRELFEDVNGHALLLMKKVKHFEKIGVSVPNALRIIDLVTNFGKADQNSPNEIVKRENISNAKDERDQSDISKSFKNRISEFEDKRSTLDNWNPIFGLKKKQN